MNLFPPGCLCPVHPLCIVDGNLSVSIWQYFCVPVISFLLPHLVYNVYMHQYMNLCLPYTPCLVHPLWIGIWKNRCPCVSLCLCPIHSGCGSTPCLECVHASVHEFMSTWLFMCGPTPIHTLMETWEPLYDRVFVSQSSHFCCHTLFRMCTCISTWMYVHLAAYVWSCPIA